MFNMPCDCNGMSIYTQGFYELRQVYVQFDMKGSIQDVNYYNKMEDPVDEENDMLDLAFGLTETYVYFLSESYKTTYFS